jgi:cell division septation protein DedD
VLIAIIILGLLTFALNYFGVIHLWGEKPAEPVQAVLPEPKILPPVEQPASEEPTPTPTPVPTEVPTGVLTPDEEYRAQLNKMTVNQLRTLARETRGLGIAGSEIATASKDRLIRELMRKRAGQLGVGDYTVQVSSWMTRSKADGEASRLIGGGMDAFVERSSIAGETWHRVRVGRYTTRKEAAAAASRLQDMLENHIFVARVSSR